SGPARCRQAGPPRPRPAWGARRRTPTRRCRGRKCCHPPRRRLAPVRRAGRPAHPRSEAVAAADSRTRLPTAECSSHPLVPHAFLSLQPDARYRQAVLGQQPLAVALGPRERNLLPILKGHEAAELEVEADLAAPPVL